MGTFFLSLLHTLFFFNSTQEKCPCHNRLPSSYALHRVRYHDQNAATVFGAFVKSARLIPKIINLKNFNIFKKGIETLVNNGKFVCVLEINTDSALIKTKICYYLKIAGSFLIVKRIIKRNADCSQSSN